MYSIETIYSLIGSMTKSEKRYFRMISDLQKGDKDYLVLFNELEAAETFTPAVHEKLKSRFPGGSIEPIRKHLYKVLMKSLRQFESDKDFEGRVINLIQDSRILYNKGMVKLSLEQLEKAKLLALEGQKFIYYVLAARQELEFLVRIQFAGVTEYELIEKQKKISELLSHESKITQHSMLYEVLLIRYWKNGLVRSQEAVTQLNDLLLQEYNFLNDPGYASFESDRLHLHFQSIYFQMTGNLEGSLAVHYDLNSLFEQHNYLWKDTPVYYFQLLDGILYDLRWMERYSDMEFFLGRMRVISPGSEGLAAIIRFRILEYQLNVFVDQDNLRDAQQLLSNNIQSIKKEATQLPLQVNAQLMFSIARVYFRIGNYSAALKLINEVLNRPASSMNHSLHVVFHLMNLQVNASMKNRDYLFYAIRSVQRKLKNERNLYGVEQLVLSFLKQWMAFKPVKGYAEKLKALSENPYEDLLIKELCLPVWFRQVASQ
jgi:hypothetical protein